MKKFLTVLLVIAVMFTFSFSTAFAAVSSTNASVIKSASAYAQSTVAGTIEKAFQTVLADKNNAVPYITEDAWEAALPTIVEAIQKAIQDEEATLLEKTDAEVESALALSSDMNITATALFPSLYMTYDKWAKELNNDGNKYAVIAAKAQFAIDYAEIVGVYDEIDVEALYSKTAGPDSTTTYYEMATDAIETSLKTLKGIFFTEKGEVAGDYTTVSAYAGWVNSVKGRVNGDIAATDITPVKAVNWDKTEVVKYYYLADKAIKTNEEVETVEATEAALKAAQKAQAAASYAAAIQAGVDKDDAAAALDAIYFLIDADVIKADEAIASGIVAGKVAAKYFDENLAEIEELEAYAEKAKAETDGEGNLVRNAEAVDAVVKAAKKVAYASFGTEYTNDADIKTIDLMNVSNDEAVLAFRKEVKKVALEDALEADLEKYYALEDTDVEAAYAVAIAAVAEMDSLKDFDTDYTKIKNTLDKALGKIKTSEDVDKLFETGDMATVITNQMSLFRSPSLPFSFRKA